MMFSSRGKECFLAENIIPDVGLLNIGPTAEIIRSLFMNRITNMKGVGKVKELMDGPIIPTPASVLRAGELLCRGTDTEPGIGSFMMADIGGATTDIYSYVENTNFLGAKFVGSPEPFREKNSGRRHGHAGILCMPGQRGGGKGLRGVLWHNGRNADRRHRKADPAPPPTSRMTICRERSTMRSPAMR